MDYLILTLTLSLVYVLLSISLNIQLGYTGLYNFGHVAFFGLGAYASALLTLAGWPMFAGMGLAMVVSGAAGFLVAFSSLRLTGDFFGIATLAFGEMVHLLLMNERWLTRGPLGLPGIPRPEWLGPGGTPSVSFLLFALVVAAAAQIWMMRLGRSPLGRALKVVREDEYVAQALGKNVLLLKVRAVVIGSVIAGVAGSLWAHYVTYVSPDTFTLNTTILILLCVVMGGKGTLWGPVLGAFLVIFFQEFLRFLPIPGGWGRFVAPLQGMVFGLALVVLMLKRPEGIIREHRQ